MITDDFLDIVCDALEDKAFANIKIGDIFGDMYIVIDKLEHKKTIIYFDLWKCKKRICVLIDFISLISDFEQHNAKDIINIDYANNEE